MYIIYGYYGFNNFGDEIFLRTFKQIFFDKDIIPTFGYQILKEDDRAIIGGGDLVLPYYFNSYYWDSQVLNFRFGIYGVGVYTDYEWKEEVKNQYRKFFEKTKYFTVRDSESAQNIFDNFGIRPIVVPDVAFAYKYNLPEIRFRNYFCFSFRPSPELTEEQMVSLTKYAIERYKRVIFLPLHFATHGDCKVGNFEFHLELSKKVNSNRIWIVPDSVELDYRIAIIRNSVKYITLAMHGCLLSMRERTIFATPHRSTKFRNLLKLVNYEPLNYKELLDFIKSDVKIDFNNVQNLEKQSEMELKKFKKIMEEDD